MTPMYCMYIYINKYADISRTMCIKWYICIQVVPVWFSRARSDMNQRGKLALRNWSCEVSRAVAKWWPGRFKWSNGRMVAVDHHQGGERERETEWILKGPALIDETHGIRHDMMLQDIERSDSDCSLFMQAATSKSRVISQDAWCSSSVCLWIPGMHFQMFFHPMFSWCNVTSISRRRFDASIPL